MRIIVLMCVLCCGSLAAQASVNVSGSATTTTDRFVLLNVDFGSTAQTLQLEVGIAATTGTAGLRIVLRDLDAYAANTATSTWTSGFSFDTSPINISHTTASYSGVRQFMLQVNPFQDGNVQFAGTVTANALPTGAITIADQNSFTTSNFEPAQKIFDRMIRYGVFTSSTINIVRDFDVDFGATTQAVTFGMEASSLGSGTVRVFDVTSDVSELHTFVLPGTGVHRFNVTTGQRSGTVRLRVQIEPDGGAYGWTLVFPQEAPVLGNVSGTGGGSSGPTGGGGGGSSGCTAGAPGVPLLIGVLGLVAIRLRRRVAGG
jgi:hypothetical protein